VSFVDVKIPSSHILGEIGQGLKIAMSTLNYGRFMIGVAMNSIMKKLLNICTLIFYISGLIDATSRPFDLEVASLKIFATESAWYICDETLQNNEVEKIMRDLRIFKILEGTNDILRQYIYSKILSCLSSLISCYETTKLKSMLLKNSLFGQIKPCIIYISNFKIIKYLGENSLDGVDSNDRFFEYLLYSHFINMTKLSNAGVSNVNLIVKTAKSSKDIAHLLKMYGGKLPITRSASRFSVN
ncbi:hypothetical protein MXB_893, partial [Myxobolus squamalis]